jgi:N-acetyl-D-muramate 6-phosphate phosphatase
MIGASVSARFDAVIFDLDGTLLDTADEFVRIMNTLRTEHGMVPLPAATARASVSDGARAMLTLALEITAEDPRFEPLREEFLARYLATIGTATRLYPGLDALLQALAAQGLGWGIVTNKPRYLTEALLARIALHPAPGTLVCPQDVTQTKPHPEPILRACAELRCAPDRAVYIGDHWRDIEAGRRAGTATIGAAYGYIAAHDDPQRWHADRLAHCSTDIARLLAELAAPAVPAAAAGQHPD